MKTLTMRLFPLLVLVPCLVLTACSSKDPGLLPGDDAQQILANLKRVEELAANGECDLALEATETISSQIEDLPGSVDSRLKQNLRNGVTRLGQVTAQSCGVTESEDTGADTEMTTTTPETEETPADSGGTAGPTGTTGERPGGDTTGGGDSGPNRPQQPGGGKGNQGGSGGGGETPPSNGQPAQPGNGNDTGGISPSEPVTPGGEETP
jgi:hypothetical protein